MNRNICFMARTAYRLPMHQVIKPNAWAEVEDLHLVIPSRFSFNHPVVTHEQARNHGALDYLSDASAPGAVEL